MKSWINPDFNPKKPLSSSSILHSCNTDRLGKRLEKHSTTMSRLSITGLDARVHLLHPPVIAEDGLASHIPCVGAPDNLYGLPYRFYLLVLSDPSPLWTRESHRLTLKMGLQKIQFKLYTLCWTGSVSTIPSYKWIREAGGPFSIQNLLNSRLSIRPSGWTPSNQSWSF